MKHKIQEFKHSTAVMSKSATVYRVSFGYKRLITSSKEEGVMIKYIYIKKTNNSAEPLQTY
jgi:hypothetical protein